MAYCLEAAFNMTSDTSSAERNMAPSLFLPGDPALDGEVIRNLFAALSSASSLAVLVSIVGGPAVGTACWYESRSGSYCCIGIGGNSSSSPRCGNSAFSDVLTLSVIVSDFKDRVFFSFRSSSFALKNLLDFNVLLRRFSERLMPSSNSSLLFLDWGLSALSDPSAMLSIWCCSGWSGAMDGSYPSDSSASGTSTSSLGTPSSSGSCCVSAGCLSLSSWSFSSSSNSSKPSGGGMSFRLMSKKVLDVTAGVASKSSAASLEVTIQPRTSKSSARLRCSGDAATKMPRWLSQTVWLLSWPMTLAIPLQFCGPCLVSPTGLS